MEVADVQPSRLARARQEIEDLLDHNPGARIGLIAFASVAHVVSPVTEDAASIKLQLPALGTDLVRLQGSRFEEALARARKLLAGEPAESGRHLLLISDGDFIEGALQREATKLARDGIRLHTLGVGTTEGGPVPAAQGKWLTDNRRKLVYSKLEEGRMIRLAEAGKGLYRAADYRDDDVTAILDAVVSEAGEMRERDRSTLVWNERFEWLLILAMLLLLGAFRRVRSRQGAPR
jgi:Ca-activated chloride channel family protein